LAEDEIQADLDPLIGFLIAGATESVPAFQQLKELSSNLSLAEKINAVRKILIETLIAKQTRVTDLQALKLLEGSKLSNKDLGLLFLSSC
jgi:hypothetical protein